MKYREPVEVVFFNHNSQNPPVTWVEPTETKARVPVDGGHTSVASPLQLRLETFLLCVKWQWPWSLAAGPSLRHPPSSSGLSP